MPITTAITYTVRLVFDNIKNSRNARGKANSKKKKIRVVTHPGPPYDEIVKRSHL